MVAVFVFTFKCISIYRQNYDMGKRVLIKGLAQCVRVFSIDIKNYVFRTNTKIKIQSSCFPVKCFVMKSVKQDKVITRAEVFLLLLKSLYEMFLKNMLQFENFCGVTLFSEDNKRIRAHYVFLASVTIPSGTCSRLMTRIHIMN